MLKTLILIHLMCSDARSGANHFLSELATSPSLYSIVERFQDTKDEKAKASSKFAHAYAQYLSAKVEAYIGTGRSVEQLPPFEDTKWPASLSKDRLMHNIPALSLQLQTLLSCQPPEWNGQYHAIVIRAVDIISKDMIRIWNVLQNMFLQLGKAEDEMSGRELEAACKMGVPKCVFFVYFFFFFFF